MPRDLILGTAGHIDHGKTALVKALTGIDTDRLPEEKARGITIDIGFAFLDLCDFRLGIVDVPGHERFIKNMLAGATGIDLVVLIVAADDSVMLQTREHLEILKLLRLKHGVIALTKIDTVDATTREIAELEIRELVSGSFLHDAPIIATSAKTGSGIDELKSALRGVCERIAAKESTEWFRLPIDRAFTVAGHGTVVTGSIVSGSVAVERELEWHNGTGESEIVRVRGLTQHGRMVPEIRRGQRGAINLAGVPLDALHRGQELAKPGYLKPSRVLTVRLLALDSAKRAIKHRLPCRLHLGTAEVLATVSVLDRDAIDPGDWALAQVFLDSPVTAVWGQPFVLRDSSAERTLGGGQVLQPTATKLRRRHVEHLDHAEKLWSDDPETRATAFAWFAEFHGFQPDDLVREVGVEPDAVAGVAERLKSTGVIVELELPPHRKLSIHAGRLADLGERILTTLAGLHAELPLFTSHERAKVVGLLDYVGDEGLLQATVDRLIQSKKVVGDAKRIARTDFKPKLSANQRKLKDKIVEEHRTTGFAPPEPKSFAPQAAGNAKALNDIFEVACAEGFLVRVTHEIFLHADVEARMRATLANAFVSKSGLAVSEIRDLLGTTRKFAIPICEYLDRVGITRRDGDLRSAVALGGTGVPPV